MGTDLVIMGQQHRERHFHTLYVAVEAALKLLEAGKVLSAMEVLEDARDQAQFKG